MDLRQFIIILKKYSLFIAIFAIFGAAAGFSSTNFFTAGFKRSQTYFVSEKSSNTQTSPNFYAENYYLQERLRNFTDTIVAILQSEDFQKEIITPGDSLQVRKVAPLLVRLTYVSQSEENASANLNKVVDTFNTQISTQAQYGTGIQLKIIGTPSQPLYSKLNSATLLATGFILGMFFALLIVGIKEYNNL